MTLQDSSDNDSPECEAAREAGKCFYFQECEFKDLVL